MIIEWLKIFTGKPSKGFKEVGANCSLEPFEGFKPSKGYARMIKSALLFWAVLLSSPTVNASITFTKDSSSLQVRQFSKNEINTYKKDKAFRYVTDDAPADNGLFERLVYAVTRFLGHIFGAHVGKTSVYTLLLYGLMIFGVVMLILQFFKITPQSLLSRSAPSISVVSEDGENIHDIDFDKLIRQSAAQGNYRLAVRFWYLSMLKVLSDAQLIKWQISKTNYDYYYEIKQPLRTDFLALTTTFENSWYGNHNLSEEGYEQAASSFQAFSKTLTQAR